MDPIFHFINGLVDFFFNFSSAIIIGTLVDLTDLCLSITHRVRYMALYKCFVIIIIIKHLTYTQCSA